MLEGAALLTALWAAWTLYSWLTNAVPAEEVIPARLVIFTAMAAMFVASLAVPGAFGEYGVLFGLAYFVVRLLQVLLYALTTGREPAQRQAILRLAPGFPGRVAGRLFQQSGAKGTENPIIMVGRGQTPQPPLIGRLR
jgi:low temperature requirement protein LtrA